MNKQKNGLKSIENKKAKANCDIKISSFSSNIIKTQFMKPKIVFKISALFLLTASVQKLIAENKPGKISFNERTISHNDTTPPVAPPFLFSTSVIINPKNNKDTVKGDGVIFTIIDSGHIPVHPPKIIVHIGTLITIVQSQDSISIVDNSTNYHNKIAIPNVKQTTSFEVDASLTQNFVQNLQPVNQKIQKSPTTGAGIKKADQKK
jgi:hypothetical protein